MNEDVGQIAETIGKELRIQPSRIEAAIHLMDDGATVPFIARYRKEVTQDLSDTELRNIAQRLLYLRELAERKTVVLNSIREQNLLNDRLEQAILAATTKTRLEDLYLPYRPKRRTKAHAAKEAGLEPLAEILLTDMQTDPRVCAQPFIHTELGVDSVELALEGAQHILMERFAEEPDLLALLREHIWQQGILTAQAVKGKKEKKEKKDKKEAKFSDYFNFSQAIHKIPAHRAMALFRGRKEQILSLALTIPDPAVGEQTICQYFKILEPSSWLSETVKLAWSTKLWTKLELELMNRLRELSDEAAIEVFAKNLRDLLLNAPAGAKVIMGLDPGLRTGCKVVVVDQTGKVLDYDTVFVVQSQSTWHAAIAALAKLAVKYHVDLISIGNGTGSREAERLVAELCKMYPDLALVKVLVNEAGASVYSASALAADEFPDLDVSLRGAVSIARRLQDPLAELVKIEPKAIGVGQYQHDVNQARLADCLDGVVEDCVNAVGVDINRASHTLLAHVSGLSENLAKQLVAYRDEHGAFPDREALKSIPRMGAKTFQQAAGFLRIVNGTNPLDASGVHPEAYPLVNQIVQDTGMVLEQLLGNTTVLKTLNPQNYVSDAFGLATVLDVLAELDKPGRDPRPEFKTVSFKEDIQDIADLKIGMILEGVVSNVTHFGAFIDIGVHQDGLIHISEMAGRFIKDPHTIVKAGDIVSVRVTEVDKERRRIGLSMKLENETTPPPSSKKTQAAPLPHSKSQPKKPPSKAKSSRDEAAKPQKSKPILNTAMADALSKLKQVLET